MSNLGIIIVNFNTREILSNCLQHLMELKLLDTRIAVVDNGSSDGSADMVAEQFPGVILVRSDNKGLSAGYNTGIKYLPNVDYYLFLGSDAFPEPGCIEGVLDYLKNNPSAGAATAKLSLRNGMLDMDAHRGFPTPLTSLTHFMGNNARYFQTWSNMQSPHEIDLCISHFMMIKKRVFDQIGLWDEDFFVYGEDVDMCWRIKESGYKIFYLPQYSCLHYKGVSVGVRKESLDVSKADNNTKSRMKLESVRAMRLFYQKHLQSRYPWVVNNIVYLGIYLMSRLRS